MKFTLSDIVNIIHKKRDYKYAVIEDIANLIMDELVDRLAEGDTFIERSFFKLYITTKLNRDSIAVSGKFKLSKNYRDLIVKKSLEEDISGGKSRDN